MSTEINRYFVVIHDVTISIKMIVCEKFSLKCVPKIYILYLIYKLYLSWLNERIVFCDGADLVWVPGIYFVPECFQIKYSHGMFPVQNKVSYVPILWVYRH